MRFLRRSLTGLFLLMVTFGLLVFAGSLVWGALQERWADEPGSRPARERVFAANVVTVKPETIRPVLSTFGEVRARRTLEIRAAAAGKVIWLSEKVEEGGEVRAGETLVRIDPIEAQSSVATAKADLDEAKADFRDAERSLILAADDIRAAEDQARLRINALERQRDLLARGVGSTAAVETAELAASAANQAVLSRRQSQASAEARVDQTKTMVARRNIAVAEAERRLANTAIEAAFDGVLGNVQVIEGRLVSAGEALAELVDPSALEVSFRVSTPQYLRLITEGGQLIGSAVTASIDILGVDIEAKGVVSRESAGVSEGQTGRLLFARLDNAPGFKPGDFVSVRLREPPLDNVVRLPAAAVDSSGTVLVVDEDDRLELSRVQVLRREGDAVIVRTDGLTGRRIVAEKTPILGVGIRIRPIQRDEGGVVDVPSEPGMVELDPERRAKLVAFVEANKFMPADAKARVLGLLREELVPARTVARIESRMGG